MNSERSLLNVEELSNALNVPKTWIYQRTSQKKLPFIKIGKYVRFDLDVVLKYLQQETTASLSRPQYRPTIDQIVGD